MRVYTAGQPIPVHVCSLPDTGHAVRTETARFLSAASRTWLDAAVSMSNDRPNWERLPDGHGTHDKFSPAKGVSLSLYRAGPDEPSTMMLRGDAGRVLLEKELHVPTNKVEQEALRRARSYAAVLATSAGKALTRLASVDPYPEYGPAQTAPTRNPAEDPLQELARLMRETGACLRAVPMEIRHAYENNPKNRERFPDAVPETRHVNGRPVTRLVLRETPVNARKFLIATGCGTDATVCFNAENPYETIEEAVDALRYAAETKRKGEIHDNQ